MFFFNKGEKTLCHTDIKLWHLGGSSAAKQMPRGQDDVGGGAVNHLGPTPLENSSPFCPHLGVGLRCFSTLILNHWNVALLELKRRYK